MTMIFIDFHRMSLNFIDFIDFHCKNKGAPRGGGKYIRFYYFFNMYQKEYVFSMNIWAIQPEPAMESPPEPLQTRSAWGIVGPGKENGSPGMEI